MAQLKKTEAIACALKTLKIALDSFARAQAASEISGCCQDTFISLDEMQRMVRDSLIQRFEFCVDLLWKHAKDYLEQVAKVAPKIASPNSVMRELCRVRLITEQETEATLRMIEHRNMSSHIYREEIAREISKHIPAYYQLMIKIVERIDVQ